MSHIEDLYGLNRYDRKRKDLLHKIGLGPSDPDTYTLILYLQETISLMDELREAIVNQ